jgi:hypothetical protein
LSDLEVKMPGALYLPVNPELWEQELNLKVSAVCSQCSNAEEFMVWFSNASWHYEVKLLTYIKLLTQG